MGLPSSAGRVRVTWKEDASRAPRLSAMSHGGPQLISPNHWLSLISSGGLTRATFALDPLMSESSPVMSVISAPLLFAHQRLRGGQQGKDRR